MKRPGRFVRNVRGKIAKATVQGAITPDVGDALLARLKVASSDPAYQGELIRIRDVAEMFIRLNQHVTEAMDAA